MRANESQELFSVKFMLKNLTLVRKFDRFHTNTGEEKRRIDY